MKPNGEFRKSLINVFKCALRKPQKQFNGENVISTFHFCKIGLMMQLGLASGLLSSFLQFWECAILTREISSFLQMVLGGVNTYNEKKNQQASKKQQKIPN